MEVILPILAKLIAYTIAVILIVGGVFRMSPHHDSKNIYINVILIFLGSVVLLIGAVMPLYEL